MPLCNLCATLLLAPGSAGAAIIRKGGTVQRMSNFIWAVGIEDTFVPQTRTGHRALDEYELMGHYAHWREDLSLVSDLGVGAVRWGVPWYRVEPQPGVFDWSWTDLTIPYMVETLGVSPIVDLIHYGCPLWMDRQFLNPRYPQAVAEYAHAFAERYRQHIRFYTPHNEPLMTALMCGRRALWPPYARGDAGYISVMLAAVQGIITTVNAIRAIDPDALMVHVEAVGLTRAAHQDLLPLAEEEQLRIYLCYDLLEGWVRPGHPLFAWLVRNGVRPRELEAIARGPIDLDILGLNFYPQWSTREFYVKRQTGRLGNRATDYTGTGFGDLIRAFWERYRRPVMITETSAAGPHDVRSAWLASSLASVRAARQDGVPVIGYTWFPLFTMIDWRYRFGALPPEAYDVELGLYTRNRSGSGSRWAATPLVEEFVGYVRDTETTVSSLTGEPPIIAAS